MRRSVAFIGLGFSAVGGALGFSEHDGYAIGALAIAGTILFVSRRVWP